MRILLLNPNSNVVTTTAMTAIAQDEAGEDAIIEGMTAPSGPSMIIDEDALKIASALMATLVPAIEQAGPDAVILSGYGDPGLAALRAQLRLPVTGIGEASMLEAARYGSFAVATSTPGLARAITNMAKDRGYEAVFRGVFLTKRDPLLLSNDPVALLDDLRESCVEAINKVHPGSVIIGGGPLALAARQLRPDFSVPIIEPIPAAVRLSLALLAS
jgi:allantoin racemase